MQLNFSFFQIDEHKRNSSGCRITKKKKKKKKKEDTEGEGGGGEGGGGGGGGGGGAVDHRLKFNDPVAADK